MYYVIVNPGSGSYRNKTWEYVESVLKEKGFIYQVFYSTKHRDVNDILTSLQHGQELEVLLIGGDGTINLAVNAIQDFSKVKIGYIPSGSGNDFGRGMGITRDAALALNSILKPGFRKVDVPQLRILKGENPQTRRFMISCGIGYDGLTCSHVQQSSWKKCLNKYGMGHLVYLVSGALSMLEYEPFHIKNEKEDIAFLAVMNQRYEGGGFMFAPNATAQDGLLDFMKVTNISRLKMLQLIPSARNGKHVSSSHVHIDQASHRAYDLDQEVYVHVDGEILGKASHLEFQVLPEKLILLNN